MENKIIVTTSEELQTLIGDAVAAVVPKLADFRRKNEAVETDAMIVEAAAKFLTAQGIPATRATVFSKRELTQWIEDNTKRPATKEDAALRIAASANRKTRGL